MTFAPRRRNSEARSSRLRSAVTATTQPVSGNSSKTALVGSELPAFGLLGVGPAAAEGVDSVASASAMSETVAARRYGYVAEPLRTGKGHRPQVNHAHRAAAQVERLDHYERVRTRLGRRREEHVRATKSAGPRCVIAAAHRRRHDGKA